MKKIVECDGYFNERTDSYDISLGDIWNELLNHIHLVDFYKSDLIIDIDTAKAKISAMKEGERLERWTGFRQGGVDHFDYIFSTVFGDAIFGGEKNEVKPAAYYYYRKLFKLTAETNGNKMYVKLEPKEVSDFISEHQFDKR